MTSLPHYCDVTNPSTMTSLTLYYDVTTPLLWRHWPLYYDVTTPLLYISLQRPELHSDKHFEFGAHNTVRELAHTKKQLRLPGRSENVSKHSDDVSEGIGVGVGFSGVNGGNHIVGMDNEELQLLYDPELHCYYDPLTHMYYELAWWCYII